MFTLLFPQSIRRSLPLAKQLDLETLSSAVAGSGVAFRSVAKLQPAAGEGTKVFPPTYAGAVYATEKRRLPGRAEPVECVLLDSVQSQANRMEEALQQAVDDKLITIPIVEVDFTSYFPGLDQPEDMRLLDPVGKVSSLQAPHRIADAILRDSLLDGARFRESDIGRAISAVSSRSATALLENCPTALVLGMWDSTGPKGGLGAKFERAMVAEIVGIDAVYGVKTSSRIDPLGIQLKAGPLYTPSSGKGWTLDVSLARKEKDKPVMLGKDGRPSEANHGNVTPSVSDRDRDTKEYLAGGVTISHAEQTVVLSLPALRRLHFPVDGKYDTKRDNAARTLLAALGLCAAALAAETGLDLRSRCLLWPTEPLTWSLLGKPGEHQSHLQLDADSAVRLLNAAVKQARSVGLPWREEPLVLTPSPELVKLVGKSQQLAVQQGSGHGEGGD
jgi:CRISPR-associated protein Csb1